MLLFFYYYTHSHILITSIKSLALQSDVIYLDFNKPGKSMNDSMKHGVTAGMCRLTVCLSGHAGLRATSAV